MNDESVQQSTLQNNTETTAQQSAQQPTESQQKPAEGAEAKPEAAKETAASPQQQYDTLLAKPDEKGNQNDTDKAADNQAEQVVYDLKGSIPEGFEYSQEETDKFIDVIKGMNLSNEQANSIAKYGFEWANELRNSFQAEIDNMVKGWGETAKQELGTECDKTIAKAGGTLALLEKEIPNLRAALAETGAGNRVEIIRAFALLNDKMAGDPGMAAGAVGSSTTNNDVKNRYPNTDFSRYR